MANSPFVQYTMDSDNVSMEKLDIGIKCARNILYTDEFLMFYRGAHSGNNYSKETLKFEN